MRSGNRARNLLRLSFPCSPYQMYRQPRHITVVVELFNILQQKGEDTRWHFCWRSPAFPRSEQDALESNEVSLPSLAAPFVWWRLSYKLITLWTLWETKEGNISRKRKGREEGWGDSRFNGSSFYGDYSVVSPHCALSPSHPPPPSRPNVV